MYEISFGEWLRRQRKQLGLTQKQLAGQINCAAITVRKMEAELRRPSIQVVERLAQILNIPPEEHQGLVRFARGQGQVPAGVTTDLRPWHSTFASPVNNIPPELLVDWESQRNISTATGSFLDANTFLVRLDHPSGRTNFQPAGSGSQASLPGQPAGMLMLVLVPVEVPSQENRGNVKSWGKRNHR